MHKVFVGKEDVFNGTMPPGARVVHNLSEANIVLVTANTQADLLNAALTGKYIISDVEFKGAVQSTVPFTRQYTSKIKLFLADIFANVRPGIQRQAAKPQLKPQPGKRPATVVKQLPISIVVPYTSLQLSRKPAFDMMMLSLEQQLLAPAETLVIETKLEGFCKGRAFNEGVAKAKEDIIILMDADIIIDKNTLAAMYRAMTAETNIVKLETNLIKLSELSTKKLHQAGEDAIWDAAYAARGDAQTYPSFPAGIIAIRKQWYELLGGVSTLYLGWGYEDLDFKYKSEHWKDHIKYIQTPDIIHAYHRATGKMMMKQNRELYKKRIHSKLSSLLQCDREALNE